MGSADYEIDGAEGEGDFAYKIHSVLEGRGENQSEFTDEEDLTGKVAEFYNEFSEYGGGIGLSSRFIEVNFEAFLEDGEYGSEQRGKALSKLVEESQEASL